ncbi:MAG: TVP38/TMEM64 family protein [Myxococcales bacterium]|nr:TVP38/TMEM64 family protein [Myxococcales bacterium]MCB9519943.1 TVP38/TMEM64 family protein [Myxococcales bacterium]MCB9533149.1 TVP38/TMEM64 family protein [Myxococcales bacterium]
MTSQRAGARTIAVAAARLVLMGVLVVAVLWGVRSGALGWLLSEGRAQELRASAGHAAGPIWVVIYGVLIGLWIPGTPLTAIGASLFPPAQAVVWNYCGAVFGSIVGFAVSRGLGRDAARTLFRSRFALFDRYESIVASRGFESVLFVRLLPTPYTLVSWVAGLSPVSLTQYSLATALGILPGSIAFTLLLGQTVAALRAGEWSALASRETAVAAVLYAGVLTIPWWVRVAQRRWGLFGGLSTGAGEATAPPPDESA